MDSTDRASIDTDISKLIRRGVSPFMLNRGLIVLSVDDAPTVIPEIASIITTTDECEVSMRNS
ncbi:MAG: hypothetical protein DWH97_13030 [Planctomycetota bacterium]|nr:MAG: hypothetical protein DWH97_13030 [Planctomycetota bacterium]RLS96206.1 MAG: hypothetical protein DWI12_02310 [Planctomycetota bacterium]